MGAATYKGGIMSKWFKSFFMAATVLVLFAQPASARDFGEIFHECGLGAMVFEDNGEAAAVSNIFWDSGTTATSSNITTPDSCKGGSGRLATFIYETYEALENDLASGDGPHLDTLLVIIGEDSKKTPELIASLRAEFATLVSGADYTDQSRFEKAEMMYNMVAKHMHNIS